MNSNSNRISCLEKKKIIQRGCTPPTRASHCTASWAKLRLVLERRDKNASQETPLGVFEAHLTGRKPVGDAQHALGVIYPLWSRSTLGSPRRNRRASLVGVGGLDGGGGTGRWMDACLLFLIPSLRSNQLNCIN